MYGIPESETKVEKIEKNCHKKNTDLDNKITITLSFIGTTINTAGINGITSGVNVSTAGINDNTAGVNVPTATTPSTTDQRRLSTAVGTNPCSAASAGHCASKFGFSPKIRVRELFRSRFVS